MMEQPENKTQPPAEGQERKRYTPPAIQDFLEKPVVFGTSGGRGTRRPPRQK